MDDDKKIVELKFPEPETRQDILDILKYLCELAHYEPIDHLSVVIQIDGFTQAYIVGDSYDPTYDDEEVDYFD